MNKIIFEYIKGFLGLCVFALIASGLLLEVLSIVFNSKAIVLVGIKAIVTGFSGFGYLMLSNKNIR